MMLVLSGRYSAHEMYEPSSLTKPIILKMDLPRGPVQCRLARTVAHHPNWKLY